jgi:hypothetical protein
MMKRSLSPVIFIFCIMFMSQHLAAQNGTIKIKKPEPEKPKPAKDTTDERPIFELFYGYKLLRNDFHQQFNTSEKFKFGAPLQLVGFGLSTEAGHINRSADGYIHMFYNQVIPQSISINDSLSSKITGGIFSLALGQSIPRRISKLYLNVFLGFNAGRLRVYGKDGLQQKNPFFAPKLGLQSKLYLGKFSIGLLVEADYDISKTSWRRTLSAKGEQTTIDKFRQEGITTLLSISYRIFKVSSMTDSGDLDGAQ